jgi:hypothetical protein
MLPHPGRAVIAQVVVVQIEAGAIGLRAGASLRGLIGRLPRLRFQATLGLMGKVHRCHAAFVWAIAQHRCPGQLQRHQGQEKKQENFSHSRYCNCKLKTL